MTFICVIPRRGEPAYRSRAFPAATVCASGAYEVRTQAAMAVLQPGRGIEETHVVRTPSSVAVGYVRLAHGDTLRQELGMNESDIPNDLSVVVALLERQGESAIRRVIGEFAFAMIYRKHARVFAARDALGCSSLWYADRGQEVAISSSSPMLWDGTEFERESIAGFLAEGTLPSGKSIYAGVCAVAPGSWLTVENGALSTGRYWRLSDFRPERSGIGEAEAAERFVGLFREAVKSSISPGKTWAELSGGLDSSSVVSMAGQLQRDGVSPGLAGTVTIVDTLAGVGDERKYSDAVLAEYPVENVVFKDYWPWRQTDDCAPAVIDEPTPYYIYYAREHAVRRTLEDVGASVVLTGIGPDQYLAGNLYYLADDIAKGAIGAAVTEMVRWAIASRKQFWYFAWHYGCYPQLPTGVRRRFAPRRKRRMPSWIIPRFAAEHRLIEARHADGELSAPIGSKFSGAVSFQLEALAAMLPRGIAEMGREYRHPFLYRPLVEFVLQLPPRLLIRPNNKKWILRSAMTGILPDKVRLRTGKGHVGDRFVWALARERAMIRALLREPLLGDLDAVDVTALRSAIEDAERGRIQNSVLLMSVLALETWLRVRTGRWMYEGEVSPESEPIMYHHATTHRS